MLEKEINNKTISRKTIFKIVFLVVLVIALGLGLYLDQPKQWAKEARIDVKATKTLPEKQMKVFVGEKEYGKASWDKGIDTYAIHNPKNKFSFTIQPIMDTNATIKFTAPYKLHKDGSLMKLWVKYLSLKLDGEEILKKPQTVWNAKPFIYSFDAKKGTTYNIEVVWDNK